MAQPSNSIPLMVAVCFRNCLVEVGILNIVKIRIGNIKPQRIERRRYLYAVALYISRISNETARERGISGQILGESIRTTLQGHAVNKDGDKEITDGYRWDFKHSVLEMDIGEPIGVFRSKPSASRICFLLNEFKQTFAFKKIVLRNKESELFDGFDGRMVWRNKSSKCLDSSKWLNLQAKPKDRGKARSKILKAIVSTDTETVVVPSSLFDKADNSSRIKKGIWFSSKSRSRTKMGVCHGSMGK
ncbi:hypothetical protein QQP08_022107 [Theobroma cacao]|nr:hypothetical protein QQP08_022107 [Theobroma cacao]